MNAPVPPLTPPAVLAVATAAAAVLLTALFALFRVDRMTDWPWWLVMSPLWAWGGILTAVTAVVVVRGDSGDDRGGARAVTLHGSRQEAGKATENGEWTMYDASPGSVMRAGWRWSGVALVALALLAGLIVGGWQAGWWFAAHDATRQYQVTQNGVSNQDTLRAQITSKLADVSTTTTQIAEAGSDPAEVSALKDQRAAEAGIVCSDAAQITGVPLPAQQGQWVAANCSDGTVSPSSALYVAGAP